MILNFIIQCVLFGVGLAMDAFSVSLAQGLREQGMKTRRKCIIAGVFGLFQTVMPLVGWLLVTGMERIMAAFQKWIPWIALILLVVIGGKMVLEGLRSQDEEGGKQITGFWSLMGLGLATSIDALSVGFTIAELNAMQALAEALIIGAVTFGICFAGLWIGGRIRIRHPGRASVLGGVILICIGIEVFVRGMSGT